MNSQVKIDISKKIYNNVTITWNQMTVNREHEFFFLCVVAKNDAEEEYNEKEKEVHAHTLAKLYTKC